LDELNESEIFFLTDDLIEGVTINLAEVTTSPIKVTIAEDSSGYKTKINNFITDINKVLKNCIDFCEFPHKCYLENRKNGGIIWKTLLDLQEHAIYDCPKFGCDICYQEEFQHMTRA
jgi:hypothetical protein